MVENTLRTQKRVVLLLLLEVLRFSAICVFTVENVTLNEMLTNFLAKKVRKYSSKGKPLGKFQYRAYIYKHLFVKACFTEYI